MVFLPRRPFTDPYAQYWNIRLEISGNQVNATQAWSGLMKGGAFSDASGANKNPYCETVSSDNLLMMLKDDFGDEILVTQWFEHNGSQYGLGFYYCVFPSDEAEPAGLIAFYRP